MVLGRVEKALGYVKLAIRRCDRKNINGTLQDALNEARRELEETLKELATNQTDDRKFYDAIMKFALTKKAELGDDITKMLKLLDELK